MVHDYLVSCPSLRIENLIRVAHAVEVDDFDGQVFLLCVLAVAAAEAALGLALLVQFYRLRGNVTTLAYPLIKA